jgi:hypothetical protein
MKLLLKLTAFIEAATGLGLIAVPDFVVQLLLGGELLGAGVPLGRVAGAALLSLGIACWLASFDIESCAARGMVSAMAFYNLGVVLILSAVGLQSQPIGIALWPAVILHAAMAVWCVVCLWRSPRNNLTINSRTT